MLFFATFNRHYKTCTMFKRDIRLKTLENTVDITKSEKNLFFPKKAINSPSVFIPTIFTIITSITAVLAVKNVNSDVDDNDDDCSGDALCWRGVGRLYESQIYMLFW